MKSVRLFVNDSDGLVLVFYWEFGGALLKSQQAKIILLAIISELLELIEKIQQTESKQPLKSQHTCTEFPPHK
ncbi:hypothetical protein [Picosynechococcus sp. NKBG15041c]|uniref:hypothetical protein n=1 Tax=Picosynechococcus sp. NKBG15041c TaxID=1407650 RepID=UPI00056F64D3|nr:hypothetical protein [Picosynechococcus sp. NKBG15041c]